MTVSLLLGAVQFADFEIPDKINFGGRQQLVVHKLPGGARIINPMGSDNDDISWSGRFRGSNAELRARLVDTMRSSGSQTILTWSSFFYTVIIKSFKGDFMQQYEIPYSIECTVVADELQLVSQLLPGIGALINGDLGSALSLGGGMGL